MALVRATTMTDWPALREIRLQALLDAPDAFASTYAREAAFGEDEWHRRAIRETSPALTGRRARTGRARPAAAPAAAR